MALLSNDVATQEVQSHMDMSQSEGSAPSQAEGEQSERAPADAIPEAHSKNSTSWDRAQIFLAQSMSTVRSHVSRDSKVEPTPSSANSVTEAAPESASDEPAADSSIPCIKTQVSEGESQESAADCSLPCVDTEASAGDAATELTLDEEITQSDGDEIVRGSRIAEASPTSTDGTVPEAHSKNATSWDRAQIFMAQSMSTVRSHVSRHSKGDPKPSSANSVTEAAPEGANDEPAADSSIPSIQTEVSEGVSKESAADCSLPCVDTEASGVDAATERTLDEEITHSDGDEIVRGSRIAEASPTSTDGTVPEDSEAGSEVGVEPTHAKASLVDTCQVFLSQSMSALRSHAEGLTQQGQHPTVNAPDSQIHEDANNDHCTPASPNVATDGETYSEVNNEQLQEIQAEVGPSEPANEDLHKVPDMADESLQEAEASQERVEVPTGLAQLIAMGFSREAALRALEESCQDFEAALERLLLESCTAPESLASDAAAAEDGTPVTLENADAPINASEVTVAVDDTHDVVVEQGSEGVAACDDCTNDASVEAEAAVSPETAGNCRTQQNLEQTRDTATRLDRAQVFVSLSMSALRSQASGLLRSSRPVVA